MIMKVLTFRGETKAGLSSYYVHLRYQREVFVRMMNRVGEMCPSLAEDSKALYNKVNLYSTFINYGLHTK